MPLATLRGKEFALAKLKERRANQPQRIDNSRLPAGREMYFYCCSCGHLSDVKPEEYFTEPSHVCEECAALKELGWLE